MLSRKNARLAVAMGHVDIASPEDIVPCEDCRRPLFPRTRYPDGEEWVCYRCLEKRVADRWQGAERDSSLSPKEGGSTATIES